MVDVTELGAGTSTDGAFDAGATDDSSLESQGWQKRSILDEPRLSEALQMYRELGFEVKVVKLDTGGTSACSVCLDGPDDGTSVVYTRKEERGEAKPGQAKAAGQTGEAELFE